MELRVSRRPSCWATAADLKSDCAAWVRCFLNVGTVEENKRENVIEVWLKCHRADVGLWRRESSWLLLYLGDVNNGSPADCRETQPDWTVTHTLPCYSVGCKVISTASPIHTVFLIHAWMLYPTLMDASGETQGSVSFPRTLQRDHQSSGIHWPAC